MSRLFALAFICALLVACTAHAPLPEQGAISVAAPETSEAELPERPIPSDSLYPLLLAEFALRRHQYDFALDRYMEQSRLLRDAGVSEHTTHLTQFLQREDEALQSAQLWVELDPDNAEANNTLGELLVRQGRMVEALSCFAVVERQAGIANFPVLISGFRQLSEEQREELVRGINTLATEFPDNTRLLLTQALIHTELQEYNQALDELDKLFRLEPEQPQALLLEARILIEKKAKNPYDRLQQVLQENPDARILRLQYAGLLTATDLTAAREQFEILSAQTPQDGDLLFSLGLINREIGDDEAASDYLRQSIALGQRNDEAYYTLGRIAEDNNQLEQAISNYMEVKSGEEYLAASSRIGQILVKEGQLDRSHTWFNEQRDQKPQLRAQFYVLEADILTQAGLEKAAMQLLDASLVEIPDNAALRYARAMLSEKQDDLVSLERDLRAILATDPDNATALNALGYTLADRTTRYTEALQLISRALALQPNEPAILDSMGWVMFRTGRYDESIEYLRRAYGEFPDPEVAAHLGEALWAKGETDAAREIWLDALQRDPGHPILMSTLDRLGVDAPPINTAADAPGENDN